MALHSIDREVLDESADDALAFGYSALIEESAGIYEAFEDGVDQFGRVGRAGRDLFEGAQPALHFLTLTTETAEPVLQQIAMISRGSGQVED